MFVLLTTPQEFMKEYEVRANAKDFSNVAPLIDGEAVYWFSDGSYTGTEQIKEAFERTWSIIKEETYTITNLEWISECEHTAVCIYEFHSKGMVAGSNHGFSGRGTNVLRRTTTNDGWKIIHEHLSLKR
jgi:ketosteroid isomerase-like protein